jgi:hypothetical protein
MAVEKEMKAVLLHLGGNMWCDWPMTPEQAESLKKGNRAPHTTLALKDDIWRRSTDLLVEKGMNTVLIDIGEGLVFPRRPELAVTGSWSVEKLRGEIARLRAAGLEVIPKINFSNTHNGWMKEYRRMVSTDVYYRVCSDVIKDLIEIFDRPRYLHLGYDEETSGHQSRMNFIAVRQGELWWRDFLWFVKQVDSAGVRPWVWSDYGWHHPDYVKRCPKCVLQSNWYYDELMEGFDVSKMKEHKDLVQLFYDLEKAGFDQVPCGSNWSSAYRRRKGPKVNESMCALVPFCRKVVAPERLKGFLMTSWVLCDTEEHYQTIREGVDIFCRALRA